MPENQVPSENRYASPSPPLRNSRAKDAASACLREAADDLNRFGLCLMLADHLFEGEGLAPALSSEITQAARYPDGAAGPRGSGMILRRRIARSIAALATGMPPAALRIGHRPEGAPHFTDSTLALHLSFSARNGLGLIAIARMPVGADIEMPVKAADIPWNLLTPDEREALANLGDNTALAFQRLWAAKEASAKLLGRGFALPPETIRLEGWQTGTTLGISGIPGMARATCKKIRYHVYQTGLNSPKASLEEPPTGGLVVVAACGALL